MPVCRNCVLDEGFPGISFDENDVCTYCRTKKNRGRESLSKDKYEKKFRDLIAKNKRRSSYDCLMALSGGKDSTYTLFLMREKYGLKVLAYTFDNWFQSERAATNVRNVLAHMHIDHIRFTPSFESFRNMVLASISHDLYSRKALERATAICTTCLSLVRFVGIKLAIEKRIPFVVLGMSPGQAPLATSIFRTNPQMIKAMQDVITQTLGKHVEQEIPQYFLEDEHFARAGDFPISVNPLAFLDYDEKEMVRCIRQIGWESPLDTDANSTNCLLNGFANLVHQQKYGFHPYAFEIAELVRSGCISRQEGLVRLATPPNALVVRAVRQKLGLGDDNSSRDMEDR